MPGQVRTSQNWIGGASIATARFIPPAPEYLGDLLSDLEMFWHNDKIKVPNLLRVAISHYQFETIHPFCDGNGRVGRLLIPFYLISKGDLLHPSLYISSTFEHHREEYYAALSEARTQNNLMGWVLFFLDAVSETSRIGCEKFRKIFALRDEMLKYSATCGNAELAQRLLRGLYSEPRININRASEILASDYQAANRLVKRMVKDGVLVPNSDAKRNTIYDFRRYLDIFADIAIATI